MVFKFITEKWWHIMVFLYSIHDYIKNLYFGISSLMSIYTIEFKGSGQQSALPNFKHWKNKFQSMLATLLGIYLSSVKFV
jgi:hypothetical protein